MDGQLYIRVRGRVLGPYDEQRLQSLARQGQLSRMHELSADGSTWVRASTYPELFIGNLVEFPVVESAPAAPVIQALAGTPHRQPAMQEQMWHYVSGGVQHGPIDFESLQAMCNAGQLGPDDKVWGDGMSSWSTVGETPGLVRFVAVAAPADYTSNGGAQEKATLPATLCRAATQSRPWVLFIAITSFVYAGLFDLAGIALVVQGANRHLAPMVASGLLTVVQGMIAMIGGFLLVTYAGRLAGLNHSKNPIVLEKALDSLRGFWIFASVLLIVLLSFIAIFVIWAVAVEGGFPGYDFRS